MNEEEIKAMQDKLAKLENDNKELRTENAKRRTNTKTAEERLAELEAETERLQREKEKADLEAKGKYDEAAKKQREADAAIIKAKAEMAAKFESLYKAEKIDKALITAANDTVNPATVAMLAKQRFNFEIDDDGKVAIMQGDSPALTKDGQAMDFSHVVESIKESDPYLVPSNGGGSGSTGGAKGGMDADALALKELGELSGIK